MNRTIALVALAALSVHCKKEVEETDTTDTSDTSDTSDTEDTAPDVAIADDAGHLAWADATVAQTCKEYLEPPAGYAAATTSGSYWIDPLGTGRIAVYCDMETNGGGWTLVAESTPVATAGLSLCTADAVGALSTEPFAVSSPAKLSDATIAALWAAHGGNEVLGAASVRGDVTIGTSWANWCAADFTAASTWSSLGGATGFDLEEPSVTCAAGTTDAVQESDVALCGYALNGFGQYLIFSATTDFTEGCDGLPAGRTWGGSPGNFGCNAGKVFVR
jgi:hypothetical protein